MTILIASRNIDRHHSRKKYSWFLKLWKLLFLYENIQKFFRIKLKKYFNFQKSPLCSFSAPVCKCHSLLETNEECLALTGCACNCLPNYCSSTTQEHMRTRSSVFLLFHTVRSNSTCLTWDFLMRNFSPRKQPAGICSQKRNCFMEHRAHSAK